MTERPLPRLLLVDDDEGVLRAFQRTFGQEYEIATATSGAAALERLKTQPVDLAIVDYQMPEMKGAELVRRIAAEHPEVPRLMLTAYAGLLEIVALQQADLVTTVLMKPWEAADVRHAIERALARAARARAGEQ